MLTPKRLEEIKKLAGDARASAKASSRSRVCRCERLSIALLDLIAEIEECDKKHAQVPILNSPEWVSGLCERAMNVVNRAKSSIPVYAYQIIAEETGELSKYIATRQTEGRIAIPMSCEKRCLGCFDVKFPHNPDCPEG